MARLVVEHLARGELHDLAFLGTVPNNDEDTIFAWQLGAGVAYPVTDSVAVTADYRWFNVEDPDLDFVEPEYGAHSGMIGLRYSF